jgi:hypothetical protein
MCKAGSLALHIGYPFLYGFASRRVPDVSFLHVGALTSSHILEVTLSPF